MNIPIIKSISVGTGRPLVLLHAFPLSHVFWKNLQPPSGYRLILPDFPGFGDSPLAETGFTLEQAAQGLQKHLKETGITAPFTLGGISMGGYWAMEFVRQFPDQISRLLLISTRPGVDKPEGRQNRLNMAERVEKEGVSFMPDLLIPGLLGGSSRSKNPAVVEQVRNWILTANPHGVALAQRAMANRRDQTPLLAGWRIPALILAGSEDSLISASESEAMSRALPDSQLSVLDRVGHLLPLEDPEEFQKNLNIFFRDVD
ncbi:MAG TPA: alpha/beta hydrolase [bacterium]|nr:alpha/beta hydrolase [bacterium]